MRLAVVAKWLNPRPGNTKGGSITVQLTSCLTGLVFAIVSVIAGVIALNLTNVNTA